MYKLAVRYDANGEIHLMFSFRHGFQGFSLFFFREYRAFRVVPCLIKKQIISEF